MGELHSTLVAELVGDSWSCNSQSTALHIKTEKGNRGGVDKQAQREGPWRGVGLALSLKHGKNMAGNRGEEGIPDFP